MSLIKTVSEFVNRAKKFEHEAHKILGVHESSKSRIVILDNAYKELEILSIKQDDLIRQSLRCVENELYRAAHVMAWAAMIDYVEEKIEEKGMAILGRVRPNWVISSMEEVRESYPEFQIIDAAKEMGLFKKNTAKGLQGLLNRRNECAHPSDEYPGLNESLGYISEIISRIKSISKD